MHPNLCSRYWNITSQCRHMARRRNHTMNASSSLSSHPNPFPFPLHRNPTPHQIFHLPSTATASDIKARYFQLVRLYHPDKAITAAYDVLRGKASTTNNSGAPGSANVPYQTTASWRAMRKRRQELYDSGPVNDGRNDNLIIVGVVATVVIALFQIASLRREALEELISRTRRSSTHAEQQRQQAKMNERLSLNEKKGPDFR